MASPITVTGQVGAINSTSPVSYTQAFTLNALTTLALFVLQATWRRGTDSNWTSLSATFNSVAVTQKNLKNGTGGSGADTDTAVWLGWLASPGVGSSYNLVASWTNAQYRVYGSVYEFTNIDPTNPFGTTVFEDGKNTASGGCAATSPIRGIDVAGVVHANQDATAVGGTPTWTELWDRNGAFQVGGNGAYQNAEGALTYTPTWTNLNCYTVWNIPCNPPPAQSFYIPSFIGILQAQKEKWLQRQKLVFTYRQRLSGLIIPQTELVPA